MNRKQLVLLIALVAVMGGLAFVIQKKKSSSWEAGEKPLTGTVLRDFPLNDVTEISIKDKDATLTLLKKDDKWCVKERNNYPANFENIGGFLRKVWDLKPVQQPKVGESQLGRLELNQPGKGDKTGTLVEFKGKDGKALGALLLGKKHMKEGNPSFGGGEFPDGRYVMVPGKLDTVCLVSESFSDIKSESADWLAKDFFKVEKLKSVSVTPAKSGEKWTLTRDKVGGDWKLAGLKADEKMESSSTGSYNSFLASASFSDVAADTKELKDPVKAILETFDGFKYNLTFAPKEGSEDFLFKVAVSADLPDTRKPGKDEKPEDKAKLDKEFKEKHDKLVEKLKQEKQYEAYTYIVSKWTVDQLQKQRKDFLAKKEEPKKDDSKTESKP